MRVHRNEFPVFCDVDKTLVLPVYMKPDGRKIKFIDPYHGVEVTRVVHEPHYRLLKNYRKRGAQIIVWSKNGNQWAEAVIMALGLQTYVDDVFTKPAVTIDDAKPETWMGEFMYLDPNDDFGKDDIP
jgi:hypothetical protein